MVITSVRLLAVILLAAPLAALASEAAPPPSAFERTAGAGTLKELDAKIRDLAAARARTQDCFDLEEDFRTAHARKKAQLSAEFKGRIPASFDDFLWQMNERANKQHKACFMQYEALGRDFTAMDQAFSSVEPKSLNVKKQRARADQEKKLFLEMVPTAKPYNRAPKAKKGGS